MTGYSVEHPVSIALVLVFYLSAIITTSERAISGFGHNVNKDITLLGY